MRKVLVDNFEPKVLLTWPVFVISLASGILTNLLDSTFNTPGNYGPRILVVFAGHVALFLAIWLGNSLVQALSAQWRAGLMVPLLVAASMLRGATVWFLLLHLGLGSNDNFAFRVLGSVTNVGLTILVTAIAVHRITLYQQTKAVLVAEGERLNLLQRMHQSEIREKTERQLDQVRDMLLTSIFAFDRPSPATTVRAISSTLKDVLEPLIERTQTNTLTLPSPSESERARINWPKALFGALDPQFLRPSIVGVALTFSALTLVALTNTPERAVVLLTSIWLGTWALLSLLKLGITRVATRLPAGGSAALSLVGIQACGFLMAGVTALISLGTSAQLTFLFTAPFTFSGLTILISLGGSVQNEARVANERLAELTSKLAWEVTRVLNEDRLQRRALSSLLHGKFQSGLFANLMKLQAASQTDIEGLKRLESEVFEDLTQLVTSIRLTEVTETKTLFELLTPISHTWDGIASISLENTPSSVVVKIERDTVLMNSLSELFAELTFNSIKHGDATRVSFQITQASANTVELVCLDNGVRRMESGRVGLGTKLLDDCALEWRREESSNSQGTRTTALLTFLPDAKV